MEPTWRVPLRLDPVHVRATRFFFFILFQPEEDVGKFECLTVTHCHID